MPQGFGSATPQTLNMDPAEFWRRAKLLGQQVASAIINAPQNLSRAFHTFGPPQGSAPDPMSNVSNTAVTGAKGFQTARRLLNQLSDENTQK
jgi:hypothetical protein